MSKRKDLDALLQQIKDTQKPLFDEDELKLEQGLTGRLTDTGHFIFKALMYQKKTNRRPTYIALTPLDEYIPMLRDFDSELFSQDTAPEIRALSYIFIVDVLCIAGRTQEFTDKQMRYREDLFNRRGELPKDNIFRRAFVEHYIDEEVYTRFYSEKKEDETYTPEGAKQWDALFNQLCEEYNEAEYKRLYDNPSEYYSDLPKETIKLYEKYEANFINKMFKDVNSFTQKESNAL